jgi:hypothetical protein
MLGVVREFLSVLQAKTTMLSQFEHDHSPPPPNTASSLFVRYVTIVNSSLPGYYDVTVGKCFLMLRKIVITSFCSRTLLVQQRGRLLASNGGSSGLSVLNFIVSFISGNRWIHI